MVKLWRKITTVFNHWLFYGDYGEENKNRGTKNMIIFGLLDINNVHTLLVQKETSEH